MKSYFPPWYLAGVNEKEQFEIMKVVCDQYGLALHNSTSFKKISSSCSWANFVLAYPTTLLNLLLIISLAKSREMNKQYGILILSLAVTDLLIGLFDMPLFYIVFRFMAEGKDPCLFANIAMPCCAAASFESLVIATLIAVERYIYIFHPFVYTSKLSKRNVAISVTVSWIVSILVIIPLLVGEDVTKLKEFFVAFCVSVASINVYCYLRILHKARKTRLQIRNETVRFGGTSITAADRRFLLIGGLIILSMFTCFAIAVSSALLRLFGYKMEGATDFRCWNLTLIMANSLVNPIITCNFCPSIRRRILKILTCNVIFKETNY